MASHHGKAESAADHEQDLATILTTEERVDLTLLIANITKLMRKQITDNFDASITSAKPPHQALNITDKNPNVDRTNPKEETEEEEKLRKLREKREKELSAPKMLELKKDSLESLDKWSESVILRVGKVMNNPRKVVEEQQEKTSANATPDTTAPPEPKVIRKFNLLLMLHLQPQCPTSTQRFKSANNQSTNRLKHQH
jgi:hypothetical protein